MKICFAQSYHYTERMGGAEVQAWLLAVELVKRGHEVAYICESLSGKAGAIETVQGVKIHWLKRQRIFELLNIGSYYRALKRIAPDVVIHRHTSLYTGVIGYYCHGSGTPFLWVCTDNAVPFRNFFKRGQNELFIKYKPFLLKRLALKGIAWTRDLSRNYGMKCVTHPCVQNMFQRDALEKNFGLRGHFFHSGHEVPESLLDKASPPVILWVGDISDRKRPELFMELSMKCRDLDATFAMISKTPSNKKMHRAKSFQDYPLENPRFIWLGALPLEETNRWFEKATLHVNTSTHEGDGFPNTYVQAWLRGVPIISFGTDPDQVCVRKELGWVVGNMEEAKHAIQDFLGAADRTKTAARVRDYAIIHHSIGSVADRLFEVLGSAPGSVVR